MTIGDWVVFNVIFFVVAIAFLITGLGGQMPTLRGLRTRKRTKGSVT